MARILVVDDEPAIREHIAAALRARGHSVAEAASRQAASDAAGGASFDVIVLDLIMADGDGFDVIRESQNRPARPRIIALSGKGNPVSDYLQCALACGADLALAKGEQKLSTLVDIVETLALADTVAVRDLQRELRPLRSPLCWPASLIRTPGQ